jgi:protoporphyrinogen oxidase
MKGKIMNVGVIGAGVSGISAAIILEKFSESQIKPSIFESEKSIGGHSSSFYIKGFTFDKGPHILFSKNQEVLNFLVTALKDNVVKNKRDSRVYIDNNYVLYPLENNLHSINPKLASDIIMEILQLERGANQKSAPNNLDEWFRFNFGNTLTELYFKPYNEKIWKIDFKELSMLWSDRIPLPSTEDIIRGAIGDVKDGYVHQLYFYYPKIGGYSAIPDALIKYFSGGLQLNCLIDKISTEDNKVRVTSKQSEIEFDKIISTMPLKSLVNIVDGVDTEIIELCNQLIVNPMYILSFGFKGEIGHSMSAGYYADPKYLVNRVSFPKNFSETTCPSDCYSVQAEITLKQGTNKDRFSNDFLIQDTLKMLKETSAIPETATPLFSKIDFFENAYVVYDVDYENKINVIKKYFEKRNIYLHGRFGSHNYLNVDGCVIESKKLVEKILNMTISLDDFFYGLDFSVVQK